MNFNLQPKFFTTAISTALIVAPLVTLNKPVSAQSITPSADGTGTTITTKDGQIYNINGGTLSKDGANLFHSFEKFGLNAGEIANFLSNPDINNILGRVVGGDASNINGLIQVMGGNSNLYLMNPSGFVFGQNASLNVPAAFNATTANAIGFADGWFNATGENNYQALVGTPNSFAFGMSNPGSIVNAGNLAVSEGQSLSLTAGKTINTGTLSAPGGNITLAAVEGENLVRISQKGMILGLEVAPDNLRNRGISPLSLPALLTGGGTASATGVEVDANGTVTLTGSEVTIPQAAGTAIASGKLDASRNNGNINVLGKTVGVIQANINASGDNGGGNILIGGDYQGKGSIPTASNTFVDEKSSINVDANISGNGGKAIIWSDEATSFYGNITARGGENAGDGGFVEVSGKENLIYKGSVDTSAANGNFGTLLLDPKNIAIKPGKADGNDDGDKKNVLGTRKNAATAEVVASEPPLNGTFEIFESELEGMSGDTNIILQANNNITLNDLPDNELKFKAGDGSITFTADADGDNAGSFIMSSSDTIRARGRNIEISGAKLTVAGINTSNGGDGGDITLRSSNSTILVNGDLNASSKNSGDGGTINLDVTEGIGAINISTSGAKVSSTSKGGNGGNVNFSTAGGNIVTLDVDTSTDKNGTPGNISYDIAQNPEAIGQIDTSSGTLNASSRFGNAGNITLNTFEGDISTADINASSGDDGTGGTIQLRVNNNIGQIDATNGTIKSTSVDGDGGNITLSTDEGNIGAANISSFSSQGGAGGNINLDIDAGGGSIDSTVGTLNSTSAVGDGGKIRLSTFGGNIQTGNINSFTNDTSSKGGNIDLRVEGDRGSIDTTVGIIKSGTREASGGNVSLSTENTTTSGNIQTATINTSSTGSGNGGQITATAGDIGDIDTSNGILKTTSSRGNGGNVSLTVKSGSISPGNIDSSVDGSGTGGAINLRATDIPGLIDTSSSTLDSSSQQGDGGNITIDTAGGNISTANLISRSQGGGDGGNVTLNIDASDERVGNIDATAGTINSSSIGGDGGNVELTTAEGNIGTNNISSFSDGTGGVGGNITLTVNNDKGAIDTTVGKLRSGSAVGSGGDVSLTTSQGNISVANINSNSNGQGNGGAINLEVQKDFGSIDASTGILNSSAASNNGGDISLTTEAGNIATSSLISRSNGIGNGGDISATTDEAGTFSTTNGETPKLDASSASGTGGDVNLESSSITVTDVNANGGLAGGNITFTGDETDIADGSKVQSNGGELQFRPFTVSQDIRVNGSGDVGSTTLDITMEEIARLVDGFSVIEIGRVDGTGTIFIISDPNFKDPVIYLQPTQQQ
ncbi:MAG: filamentous hemagglutinin N-terminal domain-containing protein [Rivularia sp. (in: Bacteria)]|nr:filamentous hemagglutinin N-terminal domain-containing protein [Rivularia sp. MS3]